MYVISYCYLCIWFTVCGASERLLGMEGGQVVVGPTLGELYIIECILAKCYNTLMYILCTFMLTFEHSLGKVCNIMFHAKIVAVKYYLIKNTSGVKKGRPRTKQAFLKKM